MLALSATSFAGDKVFEKEYLEKNKFRCIDSKISGSIDWENDTSRASLDEFFLKAAEYAKLIFNTEGSLPSTTKVTETDCKELARLKQLTSADTFLITDPDLTRGVYYKAAKGTHGIALLVMSES